MIHQVFEQFVRAGPELLRARCGWPTLLGMAARGVPQISKHRRAARHLAQRFGRAAEQFLDWERARQDGIASRAAEIRGEWSFPALENFVLVGKADRIDQRTDGLLEILDFKTGGVPAPKDMTGFEAPQLLLEAAMARAGAFPGHPAARHGGCSPTSRSASGRGLHGAAVQPAQGHAADAGGRRDRAARCRATSRPS